MHRHSLDPAAPILGLSRHTEFLRARLRGLGVAESNLEDAMQDVFEVLVRRIGDYDARFSLRQWMAGVARKVARRHRERELRAPVAVDEGRLVAPERDPESAAARRQGLAVLQRFLDGLDEQRWAVFVLAEIEGLRGTEIAAELEVNLSTVYARLRSARAAFEAAAVAERGAGKGWLAGWLAGPTSLFRRSGTAAFVTPVVLCGLVLAGGVGMVGVRGCGAAREEVFVSGSRDEAVVGERARRSRAEAPGIVGREVDPAGGELPMRAQGGPPVADAEGWYDGGGGSSTGGTGAWSHRLWFRLAGAELVLRALYSNDDDVPTRAYGRLEPDGFAIVEGLAAWPVELAVGEERTMLWRLAARREGVVRAPLFGGRAPDEMTSGRLFRFVNERGVLRLCGQDECAERASSIDEGLSGEKIAVNVRNECDQGIEVVLLPEGTEVPPADAPRYMMAAGESRALEIDRGVSFTRRGEDGRYRSTIHADTPGALVRFYGVACGSVAASDPGLKLP